MPLTARQPSPIPFPHSYVVCTEGVCGGRPHIRNTRIPVSAIAALLRQGESTEEIKATFERVAPAAIDDAVDYYFEHRAELDAELDEPLESALEKVGAVLEKGGLIRFRNRPR